jgi:ABC-type uncharacterized transport system permease subunit
MSGAPSAAAGGASLPLMSDATRRALEGVFWPVVSLAAAMVVFGLFVAVTGRDAFEMYGLIYMGAFSDAFAWQNTLQRAAPLILTALAVALPAQAGMTIIGGEGALVLGGLAAAIVPSFVSGPPLLVQAVMALAAMLAGGAWIGLSGFLRHYRGVNETIASLLLAYIAIALMNHFVEGVLRDPASLNKPSTKPIGEANMLGNLPGIDVHVGLAFGVVLCLVFYVVVRHTGLGFATRIAGGNVRAARLAGLPVGLLILWTCVAGGAAAGLAGMVEVAAVLGSANATLVSGYGYAGILVSFIARHNPLAIMPVAILIGGIGAAGSLLQRRMGLPDAAMLVLQGTAFMFILGMETMTGRLKFFQPRGH